MAGVMYGHKDGLALTFDVHRPAQASGAGVIAIVSGGWQSSMDHLVTGGADVSEGRFELIRRRLGKAALESGGR